MKYPPKMNFEVYIKSLKGLTVKYVEDLGNGEAILTMVKKDEI